MSDFKGSVQRGNVTTGENKRSNVLLKPSIQILFLVPAIIFSGALTCPRSLYLSFGIWVCIVFSYGVLILLLTLLPSYLLELHPRMILYVKKFLEIASILTYGGLLGFLYLWLYVEFKMPGSELLREL